MGWDFKWLSSYSNSFNFDYHVSFTKEDLASGKASYNFGKTPAYGEETPGISVFYKNSAGEIFHTYSTYARGLEEMVGTLMILDRAPKGRNEDSTVNFVKRHDEYEPAENAPSCCH